MAKAKAKTTKKMAAPKTPGELMEKVFNKSLDQIDKSLQLVGGLTQQERLSSGMLTHDLIFGGGIAPGMYTIFGQEQSAKSTLMMTTLGSAIRSKVAVRKYFDAENAVDPAYATAIMKVKNLTDVFGERDNKGNYIKYPKCRYYDSNVADQVFRSMSMTLNRLPDKIYRPGDGVTYFVFRNKKKEIALMKELELKSEPRLFTETGKYWCPTDDTSLQAIFFLDSYPAFIPEAIDEEEKENIGLGANARFFSEHLPQIAGKLRRKRAILFGSNQLRLRPMSMGNPEYEPGGEALKLFSSCRTQQRPIVPPPEFKRDPENSSVCLESSVEFEGRNDYYQFKNIRNIKNKFGTPFMKGRCRVWISDGKGKARGFDPVFDTWEFLSMLGAIKGTRNKGFHIALDGFDHIEFDWDCFKGLILAETNKDSELKKKALKFLGLKKDPGELRKTCFKMLKTGKAFEMQKEAAGASSEGETDDLEDLED